jgi:hypothetical protein
MAGGGHRAFRPADLIILIGIAKKNAVLVIGFALTRQHREDPPAHQAIFEAALVWFRPTMMTTMAAQMGIFAVAVRPGEWRIFGGRSESAPEGPHALPAPAEQISNTWKNSPAGAGCVGYALAT